MTKPISDEQLAPGEKMKNYGHEIVFESMMELPCCGYGPHQEMFTQMELNGDKTAFARFVKLCERENYGEGMSPEEAARCGRAP